MRDVGIGSLTTTPRLVELPSKVVQLACGQEHSLALTEHGTVLSWGSSDHGRLGRGRTAPAPAPVDGLPQRAVAVACGGACAPPQPPQCGHARRLAARSDPAAALARPCAPGFHSCALTSTGAVYTWGLGEGGRLGHGDSLDRAFPSRVEGLAGHVVAAVAAGGHHTLALTSSGAVLSWCVLDPAALLGVAAGGVKGQSCSAVGSC